MLRIGISSCFFHADPKRPIFKGKTLLYAVEPLAHWVQTEGALTYLIPTVIQAGSLADYARDLDGLVLQGGSDVSPKSYGESPIKPEWDGDYIRDQYEIELFRAFCALNKPVLGVCRGAQLMNVALGGTLIQDIATQLPNAGNHRNWEIYDQNFHEIELLPGTSLAQLYPGRLQAKVNTIHHQALKDLGRDVEVEARSGGDGVIEAIRLKSDRVYARAVQWHPEFQDPNDESLLSAAPILQDFLNAAKLSQSKRG